MPSGGAQQGFSGYGDDILSSAQAFPVCAQEDEKPSESKQDRHYQRGEAKQKRYTADLRNLVSSGHIVVGKLVLRIEPIAQIERYGAESNQHAPDRQPAGDLR